ncbi:MAG: hypothetical protein ACI9G5_002920 [Paracoccaceae bacterium]|jgi:hypothetical protein
MNVAIFLLACIVAAAIFYLFKKKPKKSAESASEAGGEDDAVDPFHSLLALNIVIRKEGMSPDLATQAEAVLDLLMAMLPQLDTPELLSSEMSWTVRRIADDYLPNKCINPFLALDQDDRCNPDTKKSLMESLSALTEELNDISGLIAEKDVQAFHRKAEFIKHRFNI